LIFRCSMIARALDYLLPTSGQHWGEVLHGCHREVPGRPDGFEVRSMSRGSARRLAAYSEEHSPGPDDAPSFIMLEVVTHERHSRMHTTVVGATGKAKVLRYDVKELVRRGGILTLFSIGSVIRTCTDAGVAVLSCLITAALTVGFCVAVWGEDGVRDLQNPEVLTSLSSYLNSFCPFILGLYLSAALNRWWTLRVEALGHHLDAICNIYMLVSVHCASPKFVWSRERIQGLSLASVVFAARMTRGEDKVWDLVEQSMLTDVEAEALARVGIGERPMVCFALLYEVVWLLCVKAGLPATNRAIFQKEAIRARDAVQKIHTYLGTQLPCSYVHTILVLVSWNNFFLGISGGVRIAVAWAQNQQTTAIVAVVYVVVCPLIYSSLLCVSCFLEDPFGDELLDFPITTLVDGVKRFFRSVETGAQAMRTEFLVMRMGYHFRLSRARRKQKVEVEKVKKDTSGGINAAIIALSEATQGLATQMDVLDGVVSLLERQEAGMQAEK